MTETEAGTGYHTSLVALRRELMMEHWNFHAMGERAGAALDDTDGKRLEKPPPLVTEAYVGCVIASSYAYALAGVLKYVEQVHGAEAARCAGVYVDLTLTNGDDLDMNADVDPKRNRKKKSEEVEEADVD